MISESRSLGWERKLDGIFHLKLNIFSSPIANKYHEGKMQSTLKRGLYAPETTVLQALGSFFFAGLASRPFTLRLALAFRCHVKDRLVESGVDCRYN